MYNMRRDLATPEAFAGGLRPQHKILGVQAIHSALKVRHESNTIEFSGQLKIGNSFVSSSNLLRSRPLPAKHATLTSNLLLNKILPDTHLQQQIPHHQEIIIRIHQPMIRPPPRRKLIIIDRRTLQNRLLSISHLND
jgi:hypothetical protein